ncbi:MAG: hypothetical protein OXF54_13700 [Caldilineaceae bacterium]|nr:hypothetical protein [Caldilineaceae bacterium]
MNFQRFYHTGWLRERNRASKGVHPRFEVGTVWRGIGASGGWRCLPSFGETQCRRRTVESVSWGGCEGRHKAGTYGDLMGLGDAVWLDTFD